MTSLGVHYALDEKQTARLLAAGSDEAVLAELAVIRSGAQSDHAADSDLAWDPIQRALTDGSLENEAGEYPFNLVILGGHHLHESDEYIVSFVSAEQVKDVAKALLDVSEEQLAEWYFAKIDQDDYDAEKSDEDFEYTWEWFENVRELFLRASINGRAVIFTLDQSE